MKKWIKLVNLQKYRTVVTFLPLVFAFTGYIIYYGNTEILNSLYSALKIYLVSTDFTLEKILTHPELEQTIMRVCFESARWLGLCVTATFITKMFKETFVRAHVWWRAGRKDAIALHGSNKFIELCKENFELRVITDDVPEKFRASKHILAFDGDAEMFRYLNVHFKEFIESGYLKSGKGDGEQPLNKSVYLCTIASSRTEYLGRGFVINNMAEDCARIYWNKLFVRRFCDSPEKRIAIIGFGNFGRALFKQALMVNVFPGDAMMEYHIFGDSVAFQALYSGIRRFASVDKGEEGMDAVFFHKDRWEQNLHVLKQADRVILADDSDEVNIQAMCTLIDLGICRIHIRASNAKLIQELWPEVNVQEYAMNASVCVFGTENSLYTTEIIMDEQLLQMAKRIHARYLRRVGNGKCVNCAQTADMKLCTTKCKEFDNDWSKIGRFLQEANIVQADHMPVKIRQLLKRDCEISEASLREYQGRYDAIKHNPHEMEPLAELEHLRWMRHHFFYGWEYAAVRDNAAKKHPLLLPFDQLPESQKPKDMDAYEAIIDLMQ